MFCDACKQFLCRICAEVKPGGRVCATCKAPCREPSAQEFQDLLAARQQARINSSLASQAENRIKESIEKAKTDREARLKADFAARKAALAEQKQSAINAVTTVPQTADGSTPTPLSPPASTAGATMYQPGSKRVIVESEDPLAHLAERSYLNVIDRAKVIMLLVSIFTLIFATFQYFYVEDEARQARNANEEVRVEWQRKIKQRVARLTGKGDKADKLALERELEEDKMGQMLDHKIDSDLQAARIVIGFYFGVAILLFVLRSTSDTAPRSSTIAAFVMYLLLNLIDLSIFGVGNRAIFLARVGALIGLYKAMHVGIALHKMREEKKAEALARAQGS